MHVPSQERAITHPENDFDARSASERAAQLIERVVCKAVCDHLDALEAELGPARALSAVLAGMAAATATHIVVNSKPSQAPGLVRRFEQELEREVAASVARRRWSRLPHALREATPFPASGTDAERLWLRAHGLAPGQKTKPRADA